MYNVQQIGGALTAGTLNAINLLSFSLPFPSGGNTWFVAPRTGSDIGNTGTSPNSAFASLGMALSLATANNGDVVYLIAQNNTASKTTNYLTSNLNWNKDGVHLIGVGSGSFLGQRARIGASTTSTSFANLLTISANNCLIANLEIFQGAGSTTLGTASTCMTVSGQRNRIVNCQISGVGDSTLDVVASNDLTVSGSENIFQHCYIGLDTVLRANCLTGTILSGTNTRNAFEDCQFQSYTSSTSYKLLTVATGTDRWFKLKNCEFHSIQNITSSAIPSGAIGITTMNGAGIVMNCGFFGITQIVTADNAYVQVLGFNGLATGHLIGIGQGVDAT